MNATAILAARLGHMAVPAVFKVLALAWLLGWGFVLLRFPIQCYRLFALGRPPTPQQLKRVRIVGYIGLIFGSIFLLELALGIIR
jgi:hypothetical protein